MIVTAASDFLFFHNNITSPIGLIPSPPLQISIIDYQPAINFQNMKYFMLLLLLSQVIDSWGLIFTGGGGGDPS